MKRLVLGNALGSRTCFLRANRKPSASAHQPHAGVVQLDAGNEDECEDPSEEDECWEEVTWAMQTGIFGP